MSYDLILLWAYITGIVLLSSFSSLVLTNRYIKPKRENKAAKRLLRLSILSAVLLMLIHAVFGASVIVLHLANGAFS